METSHLTALRNKHAGLDARLSDEARRPFPDSTVVARLKKEKLQLKQEIAGLQ
ncbi:YdcH family protein [Sphingomonas sp. ID0503]|uniref:YdcH family protein n=1 Tax=Sphingomonas sp. ID0503 TaxID=3399691 RepID=UPI003AFACADB